MGRVDENRENLHLPSPKLSPIRYIQSNGHEVVRPVIRADPVSRGVSAQDHGAAIPRRASFDDIDAARTILHDEKPPKARRKVTRGTCSVPTSSGHHLMSVAGSRFTWPSHTLHPFRMLVRSYLEYRETWSTLQSAT